MGELIFLAVGFVFMAFYVLNTKSYPTESVIFPFSMITVTMLSGIYLIYKAYKNFSERKTAKSKVANSKEKGFFNTTTKLAFIIFLSILYVLSWGYIGFELSSMVFLFASMTLFGVKVFKSIIISMLTTICYYLVFVYWLHVQVPVLFSFY